jgi:hypothetical protein
MNTDIEPKAGSWILLVGPRNLNDTMLNAIARLGESGPVRILDGGNRFNAYKVSRAVRGKPEVLNQISISRAFTCYQVLSLLESTPATSVPFVVLDMLSTFYDESVKFGERKLLLRSCISQLERLEQAAGGVVSVHPPSVQSRSAIELLEMLQNYAVDTYYIQPNSPTPETMRLF